MSGKSVTTPYKPITSAPKDGTEILVRDKEGRRSLIAWCENPTECCYEDPAPKSGWYRRAEGDWDLFDGFALQSVDPVEWMEAP